MQMTGRRGRDQVVDHLRQSLKLATKKEADALLDRVCSCLQDTLLENLEVDGFTIKLGAFGKFSIRHKAGVLRKIPFTGEIKQTKDKRKIRFVSLGSLRASEKVG